MNYVFLAVAIVLEVIGTTALKASDGFTKPWPSLLTAAAYGVCFYFLALSLRSIPVGVAYAIWSGVGIILIAGVGWLYYGQTLDTAAMIGLGLIVAGVFVVNFFSKSIAH